MGKDPERATDGSRMLMTSPVWATLGSGCYTGSGVCSCFPAAARQHWRALSQLEKPASRAHFATVGIVRMADTVLPKITRELFEAIVQAAADGGVPCRAAQA